MDAMNEIRDGLVFVLRVQEAVASVALSHREDCVCIVCRVAGGDEDAERELYAYLLS
jgi:hypothetical protein